MPRIIGVISGKGGVGKTTTAINLGAAFSSKFNKKVTIVDCNITTPHVSLALGLAHDSFSTLNEVLLGKKEFEEVVHYFSPGLSIIPASLSVHDLKGIDIGKLDETIKEKFEVHDFVILDSAPGLGKEAMSTILASDELVFVTTPHLVSISDVIRTKQIARNLGKDILGVIVNMKHDKHSELTDRQIENFTQLPVLGVINYDKDILSSLTAKQPLVLMNEKSKTSKEFIKIASLIAGKEIKMRNDWFSRFSDYFYRIFKY